MWALSENRAERPASVDRHFAECEACRAWLERDERLVRLLAWKRHEQPSPYLETRLSARVREALAAERDARGARWAEWFPTLAAPIARFGLAAIFIGMVTFQFLAEPSSTAPVGAPAERAAVSFGGFAPAPAAPYRLHPEAERIAIAPPLPAWTEHSSLSITNFGSPEFSGGGFYRRVSYGEP